MAVGGVLVGRFKGAVRHVCAAVECARGLALPTAGGSRPTLALQVDARLRAQLWRTAQVMALGFCMTLPMLLVQVCSPLLSSHLLSPPLLLLHPPAHPRARAPARAPRANLRSRCSCHVPFTLV